MFTATLIAKPGGLDGGLVESLRNAWGGGDAFWLAPDEAAEFKVERLPSHRWDIWEDLQRQGVDLVAQPSANRRKKVLIADMDSTMIEQECIDELADAVGVGAEVKGITARAMNGELDFEEAIDARVRLLAGQPEQIIADVLATRISFMPGGATLLATMKRSGAYAALVSGGFTAFTSEVAAKLGFDENRANTLLVENGKLTGAVARPVLGQQAKVDALKEITTRLGISVADAIAVGDGANDLGMLRLAGTGVALHAKPTVQSACEARINHGDLTSLLFLQGYARSEFSTV